MIDQKYMSVSTDKVNAVLDSMARMDYEVYWINRNPGAEIVDLLFKRHVPTPPCGRCMARDRAEESRRDKTRRTLDRVDETVDRLREEGEGP